MSKLWSGLARVRAVAPLASLALAALAGGAWLESWQWASVLLAMGFLLARRDRRWWLAVGAVVLVVAWRGQSLDTPVVKSLSQPRSERIEGELTVGRKAGPAGGRRFGMINDGKGKRKVMIMAAEDFRPGEVRGIKGRFFVPGPERNPGIFPRLEHWRRQGIQGGLVVAESRLIGLDRLSAPLRWAERLRDGLAVAITRGVPEESTGRQVVQAMVLGDKPPRNSEVSRAFRESGAMHVFAVSGLHVTLVGLVCWLFLRPFPVQRRTGLIIVMIVMAGYAMVTGLRPPAVRATMMAICFFGAFFVRRRPSLFNALALSLVLVVLWRPAQVFEAGFQLSYGVLLAIGLGVGLALKVTGRVAELDPFFPARLLSERQRWLWKWRQGLANLGASSLAAWVGSVPIMIWHFAVVTPVAVFTSLILIPATMAILSLAFLAALAGLLWPSAGRVVNRVNGGVAEMSFQVAKGFSKVPFGHWNARRLVPADWVIFDPDDGGAASFLDVGQGVVMEAGGRRFYANQLRTILEGWKVHPEVVVVTHPDGGHVGGLPGLLEGGSLRRAILPVAEALSPSYREFLDAALGRECQVVIGRRKNRFDLGDGVFVEILRAGDEGGGGIADHRVMVMKVHWKGWKVLVTGDLGMRGELALLESEADLSADVVWMGRHEWGVSGQHQFLAATGARAVVVSASGVASNERAPAAWLQHLQDEGYRVFHQTETGAVMMDFEADELRVSSYLDPEQSVVLQR